MKKIVTKTPKVCLCRECHGTGYVIEETVKKEKGFKNILRSLKSLEKVKPAVCPQCEGSGRVTVSAEIELDIRPYKPKE